MPRDLEPLPPGWAAHGYAGFGRRLLAQLIDSVLVLGFGACLGLVIYAVQRALGVPAEAAAELSQGGELMLNLIVALITLLFWVSWQATPGKRLLGLVIVDAESGGLPSFRRLVLRYLGYFLSALPLSLGFLWMLWDPRRQGWHDKLGRTVVLVVHRAPRQAVRADL